MKAHKRNAGHVGAKKEIVVHVKRRGLKMNLVEYVEKLKKSILYYNEVADSDDFHESDKQEARVCSMTLTPVYYDLLQIIQDSHQKVDE